MSARFIAHVERPDGRVHHIDCDAAHENDAGRLALTINTYIGAIAAYAPGAWASYRLEAPPEPPTANIDFTGSGMNTEQQKQFMRRWGATASAAIQRSDTTDLEGPRS